MQERPDTFVVIKTFNSPKKGSNPIAFRLYKEGDVINGLVSENMNTKIVLTVDGYAIPLQYVKPSEIKKQAPMNNRSNADSDGITPRPTVTKKIEEIKQSVSVKGMIDKSSKSVYGGLIGGAIGLGYAWFKGKNKVTFAVGGVLLGGILGYILTSDKK